ncbi:MAG: L-threonylcarbamoyladenylate synthase, partial [Pyrinomonadaceae bacterium]
MKLKTFLTSSPQRAAEFIKLGGIVAFPTETVYGLGADVFNAGAIEKIFLAKCRPADNPLIAHVADLEQITSLVSSITPVAEKFIAAFFPAPLTLVLPKNERVPLAASAGLNTIGVRMPNHALALEFLKDCGVPVVAPSANLSGKPSPTTWQAVYDDLNERIEAILQGEQTFIGLESTVVDCTLETPLVLRVGAVTIEELQKIVPETRLAAKDSAGAARSPGTRYKHYAPNAKVILVNSPAEISQTKNAAFIGLEKPLQNFKLQKICSSVEDYAHSLFAFFRAADEQ